MKNKQALFANFENIAFFLRKVFLKTFFGDICQVYVFISSSVLKGTSAENDFGPQIKP